MSEQIRRTLAEAKLDCQKSRSVAYQWIAADWPIRKMAPEKIQKKLAEK